MGYPKPTAADLPPNSIIVPFRQSSGALVFSLYNHRAVVIFNGEVESVAPERTSAVLNMPGWPTADDCAGGNPDTATASGVIKCRE